jgi:hypothetical protein
MASTITVDKIKGGTSGVALTLPTTDGSAGQLLKTNGSAVLSWATDVDTGITDVVDDTTPQLGGMLDVNGNSLGDGTLELLKFSETALAVNELTIANAATGNAPVLSATGGDTNIGITLTPKGTGDVNLSADTVQVGDNNVDATITTQGTGDLILNTNSGTNAGNITLADGANGNITITPNGTGEVSLTRPEIKDYSETVQSISGSFTVNTATLNSGNVIHHTGGTISFDTPSATYAGVSCTVICQAAPTISGTNVIWNNGEAPTTSGVCVYTFFMGITTGSTYKWFGVEAGKDFA